MEGVLTVAAHHGGKTNQAEAAASVMTIETKQHSGSAASLEGGAALDLYLAELGRSVAAITEQSIQLLRALAERAELLQELQRTAAPATDDARDVTPPAEPCPSS
jgi:hypothetical protein